MNTPMQINAIKKGLILTKNWIAKQSPIILTVTAVAGVVTTTVTAVRATTKAEKLLAEAKEEKGIESSDKLSLEETVKTAWKPYIPVAISAAMTVGAIIGASTIFQKRQAALAGLYALSETALKEYQEKIEEKFGEKKAMDVRDSINADRVKKGEHAILPEQKEIAMLNSGKVLVHEVMSGRYFLSDVQTLRAAANDVDHMIMCEMCASLNDFYSLIGLEPSAIGDDCGWNIDNRIELSFTSALTSDMTPCLVLDYRIRPTYEYRDI